LDLVIPKPADHSVLVNLAQSCARLVPLTAQRRTVINIVVYGVPVSQMTTPSGYTYDLALNDPSIGGFFCYNGT
jgi:hypothetical protein